GGGLVEEARLTASVFIAKGVIVITRGRRQPTQTLTAAGHAISASIPVVVLVDRNTASAAEIVAAALQDHHRATIVGTHTFGKGVFQEEEPLANGGALDITVGEYFTPNGRNLGGGGVKQGAGVIPDTIVAKGVDTRHGLDVEREAERARARGLEVGGELGLRRDLRQLTTFTVDPASAKDFDDAISAEALSAGSVRVWVHIADVSAYVPEGSSLDRAARERGTSVYVPGAVEPMLPSALSSDACSLLPAHDRLA